MNSHPAAELVKLCRAGDGTELPFQKLADIVNNAKIARAQIQPFHQLSRVGRELRGAIAVPEELASGAELLPTETRDPREPHELFDRRYALKGVGKGCKVLLAAARRVFEGDVA